MNMTYSKNGQSIVFDDFCDNTSEFNSYWINMCPHCFEKYKSILNGKEDSAGMGICSIKGCNNPAEYYIDFNKDEVSFTEERKYGVLFCSDGEIKPIELSCNLTPYDEFSKRIDFAAHPEVIPINNGITACLIANKDTPLNIKPINKIANLITNRIVRGPALYVKHRGEEYQYLTLDEANEAISFFEKLKRFCVVF